MARCLHISSHVSFVEDSLYFSPSQYVYFWLPPNTPSVELSRITIDSTLLAHTVSIPPTDHFGIVPLTAPTPTLNHEDPLVATLPSIPPATTSPPPPL